MCDLRGIALTNFRLSTMGVREEKVRVFVFSGLYCIVGITAKQWPDD